MAGLTQKALEQMAVKATAQDKALTEEAIRIINEYIDRPEAELDALGAATALIHSLDVRAGLAPANLEWYGTQVSMIVQDYLSHSSDPYRVSRDLMQIGLATAVAVMPDNIEMFRTMLSDAAELKNSPEFVANMPALKESITKGLRDQADFFTGEQPRLEAKVREDFASLASCVDALAQAVAA